MASASNLDNLKSAYQIWHDSKGGDTKCWLDLMSDHVQIRSMANENKALAFAQPRKSKQEAVAYFAAITQDWSMVRWTPETFVSEDDKVAVFSTCAWTHKGTGKAVETMTAHFWKFENGKATSFTELFDSARVIAAATP